MEQRIPVLVCFSHLRWNFVYQRPQHIMSRLAAERNVIYYEEPRPADGDPWLELQQAGEIMVATPHISPSLSEQQRVVVERCLLDDCLTRLNADASLLWYFTPMALSFSRHIEAMRVYDCMDELSMFKDAPESIAALERELIARAALVFTGGQSLFHSKRRLHANVHCFPSGVDRGHFAPSNRPMPLELTDVGAAPRAGFYGVIDERFDVQLVDALARELDDWHLFILGPVVKIDPATLPRSSNLHYLGMRSYDELPAHLEHWDVALLPFALNDATRFISPTKTLEYLAALKPVVSTPIADVIDPYAALGVVAVAQDARSMAAHIRRSTAQPLSPAWHDAVTELLKHSSWDEIVSNMAALVDDLESMRIEDVG